MTRYTRHEAEVPSSIALPSDSDDQSRDYDVTVVFDWAPGSEPTGMSGPPENYDPGEGDEIVLFTVGDQAAEDIHSDREEAIIEWLDENWERPADPDMDPDWLRDQQMDSDLDHDMTLNGDQL